MFGNDYILINDNGIDLLRNRFVYQHFDYSAIISYKVKDGYLLQNRLIIMLFSFLIMIVGLVLFVLQLPIYKDFFDFEIQTRSTKGLALILFFPPLMMIFSVILMWLSFIRSKILQIYTDLKIYNIRIKEIEKSGEIEDMIKFLDIKVIKRQA